MSHLATLYGAMGFNVVGPKLMSSERTLGAQRAAQPCLLCLLIQHLHTTVTAVALCHPTNPWLVLMLIFSFLFADVDAGAELQVLRLQYEELKRSYQYQQTEVPTYIFIQYTHPDPRQGTLSIIGKRSEPSLGR